MVEENKKQNKMKEEKKIVDSTPIEKTEEKKIIEAEKAEIKELKEEIKEEKQEIKKDEIKLEKQEKKIVKKEFACVNGLDLPLSTKHCMYICEYIKGKTIDESVNFLQQVLAHKIVVPMRGEIPHRKGEGIFKVGRYPENAAKVFIKLLRSLQANAAVNGIETPVIIKGISNQASRPHKRFGSQRFKRTHVYLEVQDKENKPTNKEAKKKS